MDLDELTGLAGTKTRLKRLAPLIGTKFRNQRLLTKTELLTALNTPERQLVEWFYSVKPTRFGLKTPFYGIEEAIDSGQFVLMERTLLGLDNQPVPDIQYVPRLVHDAFWGMSQALIEQIKGRIEISSAYRSPAFQVLIICYNAKRYDFDLKKTLNLVALPGYSEHGLIESGAIDVQLANERYVREDTADNFARSYEYKWMVKHAAEFGFKLSYPLDNKLGMPFEPWHWRYVGN